MRHGIFWLVMILVAGPIPMGQAYQVISNVTDPYQPPSAIQFKHWDSLPLAVLVDGGKLGDADGVELVREAIRAWNQVPKARQVFHEDLTVAEMDFNVTNAGVDYGRAFVPGGVPDGIVEVVFDQDGALLEAMFGDVSMVLGVGVTLFNEATGEILDGMLVLNGAISSTITADHLSTAVHEFGHILGLAHTTVGAQNTAFEELLGKTVVGLAPINPSHVPTMWWSSIFPDDRYGRTLEWDDQLGLVELYPESTGGGHE